MSGVIITGATGSIGMALISRFLNAGNRVLAIIRPSSDRSLDLFADSHELKVIECDMGNYDSVYPASDDKKYDIMIHLAWRGTTGDGRNDVFMQSSNIDGTLAAVRLANRFGVKDFIGVGSQAEYGIRSGSIKETDIPFPRTEYGIAKNEAAVLSRVLCHSLAMSHTWVRVFSVYGPYDRSSIVKTLIECFEKHEVPKLTLCEQTWNLLYCTDAAEAIYRVATQYENRKHDTYNLGHPQSRKLKEYVEDIRASLMPTSEIDYGAVPYSENQTMSLMPDTEWIQTDFNWKPEITIKKGAFLCLIKSLY